MRILLLAASLAILAVSCQKSTYTVPQPPAPNPITVDTTHLNNLEVPFNRAFAFDVNHDGKKDFFVYSQRVGDVVLQRDYKQFFIGATITGELPIDQNTEQTVMLQKGQQIAGNAFAGFDWFNVNLPMIAQQVITFNGSWWEGQWKNKANHYLPIRLPLAGGKYQYGWLELSMSTDRESITVHQAAVAKTPDTPIKAGLFQ